MRKYICAIMALSAIAVGCKSTQPTTEKDTHEEEFSNLSSCSGGSGHDHSKHAHAKPQSKTDQHTGNEADEIIFPAKQAAMVDFAVEEINPTTFSEVIKCSGEILAAQGDVATVTAPISGIVSFSGVNMAEGRQVSGGTSLFHISSKGVAL